MHFIYALLLLLLGQGYLFAAEVPASSKERVQALKEKFPSDLANLIEGYAEELNLDEAFFRKLQVRIERLRKKYPQLAESEALVIPSAWSKRMGSPRDLLRLFQEKIEEALWALTDPDIHLYPTAHLMLLTRNPKKVLDLLEDLDSIETFFKAPKAYGKPKGVQTAEMKKALQKFEEARGVSRTLSKEWKDLATKYETHHAYIRNTAKIGALPGPSYMTKLTSLRHLIDNDASAITPDTAEKVDALAQVIREHNKEYKAFMQEWEQALLAEPQE